MNIWKILLLIHQMVAPRSFEIEKEAYNAVYWNPSEHAPSASKRTPLEWNLQIGFYRKDGSIC